MDIISDDKDLAVCADKGQLEQVFMNLIGNARDALPNGGRITVSVVKTESYTGAVTGNETDEWALISVEDTGIGMDKETVERIFEPFFTTKGMGKGTGLGLAIVYGIIKQHKGHIDVLSEPGKGTVFRIRLPVIRGDAVDVQQKGCSHS
jgi:signal transduction histidine kinase